MAGRYHVVARLGGGGFGVVYKALDLKIMSRPVVIKVLKDDVLRAEKAKREWLVTKFQQEIEALSKIHDPGVAGIYDADTLPDGRPYLVMEFVEGSDLRHCIKKAREEQGTEHGLRFQEVAAIVGQVGRTLTAAHDKNIIHRDLKPENIMLRQSSSGDLQTKIIDFGIAKVRDSLIASSSATSEFMAGTWQYMSPEQLQRKRVEGACDIYALGVIAYELITGRHPFATKDPMLLKEMQAAGVKLKPRDLNPDLSVAAQEAILKALSYYPTERHKRARDFGDELARALINDEELVRPDAPAKPTPPGLTIRDGQNQAAARDEREIRAQTGSVAGLPAPSNWKRRWLFVVPSLLLTGLISFATWWIFKTFRAQTSPPLATAPAVEPARSLTFWLHVRMPKDKTARSFDEFDSTGGEAFRIGSKISFRARPTQPGFLYVINEGPGENGARKWTAVFPNPEDNGGSARLAAGQTIPVSEIDLDQNPGNETLYIVWSADPVRDMDGLFLEAFAARNAIFRDPAQQKTLNDFFRQHPTLPVETRDDSSTPHMILTSRSDLMVSALILKHRSY